MSAGPNSEAARPAGHRADWYPDPTRRFEFRYHNGEDWTGDVSVDGNRFLDPLPRRSSDAATAETSVAGAGPVGPARSSATAGGRSGKATAALVLGIASVVVGWVPFVFVLGAIAAILALVFGAGTMRRVRRDPVGEAGSKGFAVASLILAPLGLATCGIGTWLTVLAYREVDRYTDVGEFDLVDGDCSVGGGVATFEGTITNRSDAERGYHLEIQFLRPDTSSVLYRTSADVDDVAPGETTAWSVREAVSHDELDCVVDEVSGPLPFQQR